MTRQDAMVPCPWPDLIVAFIMAALFLHSAQLILRQALREWRRGEDLGALMRHDHEPGPGDRHHAGHRHETG
jgi:hypothetical protein